MNEQFANFPKIEDAIQQQRSLLDGYRGGRKVSLLLDEWGVWDKITAEVEKKFGALWQRSTMRSAVAVPLGLNIFNRQADKLYMCNVAQIVNVLQSMLLTDGPDGQNCVRTRSYCAFELFKPHRSKTSLKVETDVIAPVGLSASASKKDQDLVITLVNPYFDEDLHVDCALRGATATQATARILHDADLNAYNTFEDPNRVVPRSHPVSADGTRVRLDLPRLSAVTVTVRMA
jgi:alpha-N-arabinofuranosidase